MTTTRSQGERLRAQLQQRKRGKPTSKKQSSLAVRSPKPVTPHYSSLPIEDNRAHLLSVPYSQVRSTGLNVDNGNGMRHRASTDHGHQLSYNTSVDSHYSLRQQERHRHLRSKMEKTSPYSRRHRQDTLIQTTSCIGDSIVTPSSIAASSSLTSSPSSLPASSSLSPPSPSETSSSSSSLTSPTSPTSPSSKSSPVITPYSSSSELSEARWPPNNTPTQSLTLRGVYFAVK